jgi:hypothetical protein
MALYLISFDEGTMVIPDGELPEVARAARQVVSDARAAGVFVTGGGVASEAATIAHPDGTVTSGPYPETKTTPGGLVVVDVATREEAVEWAARWAAACRCAQEVRELF